MNNSISGCRFGKSDDKYATSDASGQLYDRLVHLNFNLV